MRFQVRDIFRVRSIWPHRLSVLPLLLAVLFIAAAILPARSVAQSQNAGTVSGNVTDGQGNAVVNAAVTLTSAAEGTVLSTRVNDRGEYLFSSVKTGTYTLTVTAPTFQKFIADSIAVNVTENVRMDAKLSPGSVEASVTVDAPSMTVDTRSATVATIIDPTLVQNLPVDGNNIIELTALLPGVTAVNAPATFTNDTGGPSYIVSGSRANQNLFLFDGVMWNNVYYNTGLNFPPVWMTQEVSVQLVNFKAQYGRNVGSVMNVLSRSGSNQFHGTLWEYMENSAFNARDYITGINPHLVQNQFGATIGGPIKRDKLFFFLGYQDLRSSQVNNSPLTYLTNAERGLSTSGTPRPCITTGVWTSNPTGLCASFADLYPAGTNFSTNGVANPLYVGNTNEFSAALAQLNTTYAQMGGKGQSPCATDMLALGLTSAGTYFPNAEVPYECINPVAVNLLNKYTPSGINTVATEIPGALQPRNDQNGLARVDWNLGRHTLDARFYVTNTNDLTANAVTTNSRALPNYEPDYNLAGIYNGNVGDTWVLTPNLLNIVRLGYKRYNYTINPTDPTTLQSLGSNFFEPGHPALPRISVAGTFSAGAANTGYSYSVNADDEFDESLSWTHSHHTVQVGFQYLNLQYIHRFDNVPYFDIGNQFTGNGASDLMMGFIYSETVGNSTNIGAIDHAYYFYGQDDWRTTARLTLNLGLRYELTPPWFQPDGQSVTFNPGYQSYRFTDTPASLAFQGDPGIPNAIIKTNYTNLAPRFGLAYDLFGNGRTSIRAGFGIFYDALNANTTGIGQPYHYQATYQLSNGSLSAPLASGPLGTVSPVPANYTTPATAQFGQPYTVNFADPNVTEPYNEAINFGIQQRIGQATLEAIYVGKFGRHQIVPYDLNPAITDCSGAYYQSNPQLYASPACPLIHPVPGEITNGTAAANQASDEARVRYPGFNYGGQGIVDNNSVGSSSYNGLQVIYTQRSRNRLTMTASYTYSRSLDDQSSGTTNSSALPLPPIVKTNFGPSDFQATHVFNMGWVLTLPSLKTGSNVLRAVANNWVFSGIFNARTGNPFNITTTNDWALNAEPNQRPPLAPGLTHYVGLPSNRHRAAKVNEWFNVCSFANGSEYSGTGTAVYSGGTYKAQPCSSTADWPILPEYTNGISRNYLYGPAFIESDLSVRRTINIPFHQSHLQFRADAINAFNTPNLANPVSSITASESSFNSDHGQILSTVGKNGGVGTNGRRIQLALILNY